MSVDSGVATQMFGVAVLTMALFLLVWCLKAFTRFRLTRRARHGASRATVRLQREARGLKLMKAWLSPAQLRSYEARAFFEVVGSHSGSLYRIHHGTQANVEQRDGAGHTLCAWCFVPEGDLVPGDVMLAQKIALETDEDAALAVAIKYEHLRNLPATARGRFFAMM